MSKVDLPFLQNWFHSTYARLHHLDGKPCLIRVDQIVSATYGQHGQVEISRPDGKWLTVKESPNQVQQAIRTAMSEQTDWVVGEVMSGMKKALQHETLPDILKAAAHLAG